MWDWVSKLAEPRAARAALLTVVGAAGSTPREIGAKMLVWKGGGFHGTIGGGRLEQLALEEAALRLASGTSGLVRYPLGASAGQCCGGVVEIFFEILEPSPTLYVFGAGHVGQAVARVLSGTAFHVHLVDERDDWLRATGLGASITRHAEPWDDVVESTDWESQANHAVVMTHRHDLDQAIVEALIPERPRYLGLIGSRPKWARFRERLLGRGFTAEEILRVKCPIGTGRWGKAPQEVAISLAAELLALHYGKNTNPRTSRGRPVEPDGPAERLAPVP